jgi:hypothetical protein
VADEVALTLVAMLIGEEETKAIADFIMYDQVEPEELRWTAPVAK